MRAFNVPLAGSMNLCSVVVCHFILHLFVVFTRLRRQQRRDAQASSIVKQL